MFKAIATRAERSEDDLRVIGATGPAVGEIIDLGLRQPHSHQETLGRPRHDRGNDFCHQSYSGCDVTAVANGTDALALPLMAWGIGRGDAVFVPSFTFAATAEIVPWFDAEPVFSHPEFDMESRIVQAEFGISQPAVSQHLKVLKDAGLVTDTAEVPARMPSETGDGHNAPAAPSPAPVPVFSHSPPRPL
mgnify:CR=1 FL=1